MAAFILLLTFCDPNSRFIDLKFMLEATVRLRAAHNPISKRHLYLRSIV